MKLRCSSGIIHVASLTTVFLLCLGAFLYPVQLAQTSLTSMTPAAATSGNPAHAADETPAGVHPLAGNYLTPVTEETESGIRHPVNVEYLTALLFAVFFGAALGLLFGGGQLWNRNRVLLFAERRLPAVSAPLPRDTAAPLLSVFTL